MSPSVSNPPMNCCVFANTQRLLKQDNTLLTWIGHVISVISNIALALRERAVAWGCDGTRGKPKESTARANRKSPRKPYLPTSVNPSDLRFMKFKHRLR